MGRRQDLHDLLMSITEHVYFQPPANVQMVYPCVVYQRDNARTIFAGNAPYRYTQRYQITIISLNPDNDILDQVAKLPMCEYQRYFSADNLNHDVFVLYF